MSKFFDRYSLDALQIMRNDAALTGDKLQHDVIDLVIGFRLGMPLGTYIENLADTARRENRIDHDSDGNLVRGTAAANRTEAA